MKLSEIASLQLSLKTIQILSVKIHKNLWQLLNEMDS